MPNLVDMTCRVVPYFANLLFYSVATLRYGDQAEWNATIGTGALPHILGESSLGLRLEGRRWDGLGSLGAYQGFF